MLSFKHLLLVPPSLVTAAVALKLSAPAIVGVSVSDLPSICNGISSWFFTPWYMFLVINGIIAAIFASSKLFAESPHVPHSRRLTPLIESIPTYYPASYYTSATEIPNDCGSIVKQPEANSVPCGKSNCTKNEPASFHLNAEPGNPSGLAADATSNKENECILVGKPSLKSPIVKPLATAAAPRFADRRNFKSSSPGRKPVLGISRATRQHTLEDTWKVVTEGRATPLTRRLSKPEMWEKTPPPKTSNDNANARSPSSAGSNDGAGVPRRDELNRRVEAFIRMFKEDMRLQRQESLNSAGKR